MKYTLIVRPEAARDIEGSFNWYENQELGLGNRFVLAIRASIQKVVERPFAFQIVLGKTRRFVVERFPYSIFYIVGETEIAVTACIHQRRHPRFWNSRNS